jgi:NADPH-dependent 2,4-dienoyl-CoA reductase/sulfur reductase-like enzyme
MRLIVIGGDAAGMSAASRAKRSMPDMEVVVLEQTMDVSYSACSMPYNIADPGKEMNDLVVRQAEVFRKKQGIDLRTGHMAEAVDADKRIVTFTNQAGSRESLEYDKLLIATGASPIIPDLPGIDLPGVLPLKSLEEGRKIKQFIKEQSVKSAVIIGMGYIALEMCEALRANDIDVSMVKPRAVFIPWMADELSVMIKQELEKNDVKIYAGHEIEKIKISEDHLVVQCSDINLKCDMVICAIGVNPNSSLAEEAGIELGIKKSIAVDRTLKTSKENIYAAGDCADTYHVVTGEKAYIPLALRANRAGWAVADNVTGANAELDGVAGTSVFKVFDMEVARTGLDMNESKKAGFDPVDIVIRTLSRAHVYPGNAEIKVHIIGDKKSGRLLGMQMVGTDGVAHRINAPAVALHNKMTVEGFIQCDLAYAPPFGPVWDPVLTAAVQLMKRM